MAKRKLPESEKLQSEIIFKRNLQRLRLEQAPPVNIIYFRTVVIQVACAKTKQKFFFSIHYPKTALPISRLNTDIISPAMNTPMLITPKLFFLSS